MLRGYFNTYYDYVALDHGIKPGQHSTISVFLAYSSLTGSALGSGMVQSGRTGNVRG